MILAIVRMTIKCDWFDLNHGHEYIKILDFVAHLLGLFSLYYMHILIVFLCFHHFPELLCSKCFLLMERSCLRTSCGTPVARNAGSHAVLLLSSIAQKRYVFLMRYVHSILSQDFTFKQFLISILKVRMQEAILAKEKMHGRLACSRPLVVRLAGERYALEKADSSTKAVGEGHKLHLTVGGMGQTSRSAKIAAIKNKLKSLEEDNSKIKKQKLSDNIS